MTTSKQMPGANAIQRSSLQQEITNRLRNEIVEGVWEPGVRLQERLLCERYNVSRSPLRESFHIMVKEGLVKLLPGRGAVVTRPTMTDALENAEVIISLETLAIRLACERASDETIEEICEIHQQMAGNDDQHDIKSYFEHNNELHRSIVAASGNAVLISVHENLMRHITRLQNLSGALEASPAASFDEHEVFIAALKKRDAAAAAAGLQAHLESTVESIKRRIEKE